MNTCILVVFVATIAGLTQGITREGKHKIHAAHSECQSDANTKVDDDILKNFYKGETVDQSVIGPHILCVSTKLGLITQEGKIDRANLRKGLGHAISDETKIDDTVEKCAVNKDTPEETAIALEKCFIDNVPRDHDHHHHHGHHRHHHH